MQKIAFAFDFEEINNPEIFFGKECTTEGSKSINQKLKILDALNEYKQ